MKRKLCSYVLMAAFLIFAFLYTVSDRAEAADGIWKHNKKGWWYEYADGSYATGWLQWEGQWYYFLDSGYMESSGYRKGYWIGKNGVTSLKYAGGRWRKDARGWWFRDKTGWYPRKQWLKIDGVEYYFDAEGYLATSQWVGKYCVDENGVWDPEASTEWAQDYMEYMKVYNAISEELWGVGCQTEFSLIYLDADSTPELVAHVGEFNNQAEMNTCVDGKVRNSETSSGVLKYIPRSGLVLDDTTFDEVRRVCIYRMADGEFKQIGQGTMSVKNTEDMLTDCKWDGETISEDEFIEKMYTLYPDRGNTEKVEYISYEEMNKILYKITRK